jgi:hypothetical protein
MNDKTQEPTVSVPVSVLDKINMTMARLDTDVRELKDAPQPEPDNTPIWKRPSVIVSWLAIIAMCVSVMRVYFSDHAQIENNAASINGNRELILENTHSIQEARVEFNQAMVEREERLSAQITQLDIKTEQNFNTIRDMIWELAKDGNGGQ